MPIPLLYGTTFGDPNIFFVIPTLKEYFSLNQLFYMNNVLGDPMGATCLDGNWSPNGIPTCEPRNHPHIK